MSAHVLLNLFNELGKKISTNNSFYFYWTHIPHWCGSLVRVIMLELEMFDQVVRMSTNIIKPNNIPQYTNSLNGTICSNAYVQIMSSLHVSSIS